jgi:hypothetical protein
MKIHPVKIADLISAEYNPRKLSDTQRENLADSLKRFGLVDPIIVNKHPDRENILVGGHQRTKVWKDLGNDTIPAVFVELDRDKERELNVRLNKNTGDWDMETLLSEFDTDELTDWGWGSEELATIKAELEREVGELAGNDDNAGDGAYTSKIEAPTYEITGKKPNISELVDLSKSEELKKEITGADIPEQIKLFLCDAADRHKVFDYGKIAEYYAHADANIQDLMERSALVIIDFDKALENGYTRLSDELVSLYGQEYPDA